MNKGQTAEKKLKKILKFFKMNEDTISTIMGGIVIVVIIGLVFNYFRSSSIKNWQGMLLEQNTASTTTTTDTKEEKKLDDKYLDIYKVVKGDDLWHISERFYKSGYNYVDIIKENKLNKAGVITSGMELKIPKVEARRITVKEVKKDIVVKDGNFEPADKGQKIVDSPTKTTIDLGDYVTQKGDSLWSISVRAYGDGFKWTKIYWANRKAIANPDVIYPGVKLTIPKLDK